MAVTDGILGTVACVTVTYHPELTVLAAQLRALPGQSHKVVVDNGSPDAVLRKLKFLVADIPNLEILELGENLGLATATNIGAAHATLSSEVRLLLILDQDSEPCRDAVLRLVEAFNSLSASGAPVGAVGPALLDPLIARRHGFHVIEGLRWRRIDPDSGPPLRCDSLNGSGTLVDLALFHALGGLDGGLFIDHVDTEWSFRMAARGKAMYGVPAAEFIHRMGDSSKRVWLGSWRVWPLRSPLRHRYLFRNAVLIWSRPYVPLTWKLWMVPKLLVTLLVYGVVGPMRWRQLSAMLQGIVDGLCGRNGAI